MKPVLKHIFQLKRTYEKLPFFDFLRDDELSTRERLAFFPCMASFIMSFGDLNRLVLRSEPTDDPWLKMINAHTYEDDHHWPWYLEDYTKLGHDDTKQTPGDTLRFLYSDATIQNRLLAHRLAHLVWGAEPVVRLAIIEAIEETGNILFALTSKIAAQYQRETGVELRYCGEFHFNLESGHAMNNDHAELAQITLDAIQQQDALQRVDLVFEWFALWTHELLAYANGSAQGAPRTAQAEAELTA
ncbi:MAG: hypothetical protein PSV26_21990 [Polaromonas sp.]|uniref:hypothetical protein n=1 Tax=Polaromonas sp. TaxID=1869339 RepID=UPI00248A0E79|nr:hypothetical protein [Polaromonas sp.]MDI1240162.1 hypothetical protein [Polaromonas sp.]